MLSTYITTCTHPRTQNEPQSEKNNCRALRAYVGTYPVGQHLISEFANYLGGIKITAFMTAMNNNRRVPTDGGALPNDVSIVFSNDDAGCTCGNPNAGRSNQEKELKKETDNFLMVSIHFHGCTF